MTGWSRTRFRSALAAWQLPSYRTLADYLTHYQTWERIGQLWHALWQEPLPRPEDESYFADIEVAQSYLMNRVNDELFPVDLTHYDALYEMWSEEQYELYGEEARGPFRPIEQSLQVRGHAPNWPHAGLEEIEAAERPLAAAMCLLRASSRAGMGHAYMEELRGSCRTWWCKQHLGDLPRQCWLASPEEAVRRLCTLPSPLDGLAIVYQTLARCTGNPFLDEYQDVFWDDYWDRSEWHWCVQDILTLRDLYQAARPALAVREAYLRWFETLGQKHAAQAVASALRSLDTPVVPPRRTDRTRPRRRTLPKERFR